MKITLDHNCLINLSNNTIVGQKIREIVDSSAYECFVVNIGASEMRERGVVPDRYDLFEKFLEDISLSNLKKINPVGVYDVTFWDHCVYAGEQDMELLKNIELVLFPNKLEQNTENKRKQLNRLCDIHSMWCHISSDNDIFLTSDKNFMKQTKRHKLINLGAKDIKSPEELNV